MRGLVGTRQAVSEAQQRLAEAQRADALAYATALRAGWSNEELKRMGFAAPERQAPGRPPGRRRVTPGRPSTSDGAATPAVRTGENPDRQVVDGPSEQDAGQP